MELDEVRQEVIGLVAKIKPDMQAGVWNPDDYRTHYLTPFRARDLNVLAKYERQHHTIFCRQCLTKDKKKGLLLVYQLWIEETDNGLDNKPGEWVSLQCQNPDCDFDLVTPRPETPDPAIDQQKRLDELLQMYQYNTPQWVINDPQVTIDFNAERALSSAGTSSADSAVQAPPPPKAETLLDKLKEKYLK